MNQSARQKLRCLLHDERGQVLPLVAVAFVVLLGISGLTLDVGRTFYVNRALQQAADSAALAGAGSMRTATTTAAVISAATSMSGVPGSVNARDSVPSVTMSSGYPALKCLKTLQSQGMACQGAVPYNAIQVQEQSVVPMYFASLFGMKTMTTVVSATASSRGGAPSPYNVAVVIDSTLSMAYPDTNCGNTQIMCALNGVQILLHHLSPCAASLTTCVINNGISASSVDRVALFTFPDVSAATVANYTTCTTAVPAPSTANRYWSTVQSGTVINFVMPMSPLGVTPVTPWSTLPAGMGYSFPTAGAVSYVQAQSNYATYPMTMGTATYQITPFLSDYRTSNTTLSLNPSSVLVKAVGGVIGCGGMAPPNYDGIFGTYYAGAIYAAQSALVAQQAANPGSGNVMIILGDGDNNAPQQNGNNTVMASPASGSGKYPSWIGECGQAVVAAQFASNQGTQVYSVAYGAGLTGCTSDLLSGSYPNITPCQTMAALASAPQYFYSDYQQSGTASVCVASQPVVSLNDIFTAISSDLSTARLIPNGTT